MRNRDKERAEKYTPEEVKKAHDIALKAYIESGGTLSNKCLARRALVPAVWVSRWDREENWRQFLPGYQPGDKLRLSDKVKEEAKKDVKLSDKEWTFCWSYYKCKSATQAALNAGYSVGKGETGFRLLSDPRIRDGIEAIRKQVQHESLVEATDIVNMWAKIAFADMTDYVDISRAGVFLKPSKQIDGQVIQEVKEGRDGVTIKLADRMKALDKLSEYLGVTPEDKSKMAKQILAQRAVESEKEDDSLVVKILGV